MDAMQDMTATIEHRGMESFASESGDFEMYYLGGKSLVFDFAAVVQTLKEDAHFSEIYFNDALQSKLNSIAKRLTSVIDSESRQMDVISGQIATDRFAVISRQMEILKDITWCLQSELLNNIKKVRDLTAKATDGTSMEAVAILKKINAVLNSIDRLEVRGRDSAGFSLLFVMDPDEFDLFQTALTKRKLVDMLAQRSAKSVLVNNSIRIHERAGQSVSMAFVYKIAAEIGGLGDNIIHLRRQIRTDPILQTLLGFAHRYHTVSSHTRWASVGAITEPNCHPVDNITTNDPTCSDGIIHACLNGDIDNFLDLKLEYEKNGGVINSEITTDTKIIPLQIEKYIKMGNSVEDAFRLAVNDFKGSHAISMHTDLAPGKFFLAQRGSGQAIFVGLAIDHYMPASEVYGFIEETSSYLKMDGEKIVNGNNGPTQGQIFILDQDSTGGSSAIRTMFYDGTLITLGDEDIKHTDITSRDIDRRDFPHYFLKEISESPRCVEQTLENRWKISKSDTDRHLIALDETVIPPPMADALTQNRIKRVFFIGQGTAGVAAQVCADILNHYLADPSLQVMAFKASELSGFKLGNDSISGMDDALVIAISQSGTTTDTNRAVDMVRERGGHTLAIVNRRDSDVTFKVDGVLYTSSGRDIEMSVASTKAFYSQIIAGALLSLYIADIKGCRSADFISEEIEKLIAVPSQMRQVLNLKDKIKASADRHAAD
ncbi:MAG: SIS domain-containing protein, partial [Deltaproteobacteria bacterium]|nr:SIS domain-containing protein [Deltaproteobacteria bacterium]